MFVVFCWKYDRGLGVGPELASYGGASQRGVPGATSPVS